MIIIIRMDRMRMQLCILILLLITPLYRSQDIHKNTVDNGGKLWKNN